MWGDILDKMAKNCMKITKPTFYDKTVGEHGGLANFFKYWGDPKSSPNRRSPTLSAKDNQKLPKCLSKGFERSVVLE